MREPRVSVVRRAVRAASLSSWAARPTRLVRCIGERGHLHHRPEHQLNQLWSRLQVCAFLTGGRSTTELRVSSNRSVADRRAQGARRRQIPIQGGQPLHPSVVPGSHCVHQAHHPITSTLLGRRWISRRPIGMSIEEVIRELVAAGLDSIRAGAGRSSSKSPRPRREKEAGAHRGSR